jgi:hypothetical protein
LLLINISVFGVAASLATIRYLEEKKKSDKVKEISTKKVEWACNFANEKFKTTFDAILEHSVPPSSCLVFWYTDLKSAEQALNSGIPAVPIQRQQGAGKLNDLLGQRNDNLGGVYVTLHDPTCLDEQDLKIFPVREVVLACSVPRRWLTSLHNVTLPSSSSISRSGGNKNDGDNGVPGVYNSSDSVRVISSFSLQAMRTTYFGFIEDSRPWLSGGIFLPPKVIRRAYQLISNIGTENGTRMFGTQKIVKVIY